LIDSFIFDVVDDPYHDEGGAGSEQYCGWHLSIQCSR